MKNTVICGLIIGLSLVFSGTAMAAGEQLVVKASAKNFSFPESKSIEVQTLVCKESDCVPVEAKVSQFFDILKIENLSLGKYRFSKMTNLPLVGVAQTTVTFEANIGGQDLQVQEKVKVNPTNPKAATQQSTQTQAVVKKQKNVRKWVSKKSLRYRRYMRQLRRQQARARRIRARKAQAAAQQEVSQPAPEKKAEEKPKVAATEKVRTLPGQLPQQKKANPKPQPGPSPFVAASTQQLKVGDVKGSDSIFWLYLAPVILLIAIPLLGVLLNTIRGRHWKPRYLIPSYAVCILAQMGFLITPFQLTADAAVLYLVCSIGSLVLSSMFMFYGVLTLQIYHHVEHLHPNPKAKLRYVKYFSWVEFLKSEFNRNHRGFFKHYLRKSLKYATSFMSCIVIIFIIHAIILGQSPPTIYDAQQTAVSRDGLIAVYEIQYSDKLFNAQNSFSVKGDLVIRPIGGHFYEQKDLWQLGDDVIDIARKYGVHIFTTGDRSVEVWSPKNLTPLEVIGLIEDLNSSVKRAFSLSALKPSPKMRGQEVATRW